MVRALSATRIDLSGTAQNKAGAVQLAARQYENNVPVLRAMAQEIENRQLASAGTSPTQQSGFEGFYMDVFGNVTGPDGYAASSTMSQAFSDIEHAQNNGANLVGSLAKDGLTTAALTMANPALGAGYAALTSVTGIFSSGDSLDKLYQNIQTHLNKYEEIRVAAATKMGAQYGGTNDGGDMDAPRFEGYRMAENAPKTPQPMMGMPAPSMA
jgi:hypothetical protein